MNKLFLLGTIVLFLLISCISKNSHHQLRNNIERLSLPAKGKVGIAIQHLEKSDTLSYNGHARCVMQSVFKFPIAMAVLHAIDEGKFSLDQKIHISKSDLRDDYSPIRDKYPEGNVDISIREILGYTVSQSDNIGCDILLQMMGGPVKVNDYIHSLGVQGINIAASEMQMHADWKTQYTNWCEPLAMLQLLKILYEGKSLSTASNNFLLKILRATSTGAGRMKALLPAGTEVAHKTGTGPVNEQGMTAATNDVGIITLPNGNHLAVVVFISDAFSDERTLESTIARISKAAYDDALTW